MQHARVYQMGRPYTHGHFLLVASSYTTLQMMMMIGEKRPTERTHLFKAVHKVPQPLTIALQIYLQ